MPTRYQLCETDINECVGVFTYKINVTDVYMKEVIWLRVLWETFDTSHVSRYITDDRLLTWYMIWFMIRGTPSNAGSVKNLQMYSILLHFQSARITIYLLIVTFVFYRFPTDSRFLHHSWSNPGLDRCEIFPDMVTDGTGVAINKHNLQRRLILHREPVLVLCLESAFNSHIIYISGYV